MCKTQTFSTLCSCNLGWFTVSRSDLMTLEHPFLVFSLQEYSFPGVCWDSVQKDFPHRVIFNPCVVKDGCTLWYFVSWGRVQILFPLMTCLNKQNTEDGRHVTSETRLQKTLWPLCLELLLGCLAVTCWEHPAVLGKGPVVWPPVHSRVSKLERDPSPQLSCPLTAALATSWLKPHERPWARTS